MDSNHDDVTYPTITSPSSPFTSSPLVRPHQISSSPDHVTSLSPSISQHAPGHLRPTLQCEPDGRSPHHPHACNACFIFTMDTKDINDAILVQEQLKETVVYLLSKTHEYDDHLSHCDGVGKVIRYRERTHCSDPYPKRNPVIIQPPLDEVQSAFTGSTVTQPMSVVPRPLLDPMVSQPTSAVPRSLLDPMVSQPTSAVPRSLLDPMVSQLMSVVPRPLLDSMVTQPTPEKAALLTLFHAIVEQLGKGAVVPRPPEEGLENGGVVLQRFAEGDLGDNDAAPQADEQLPVYSSLWEEIQTTFEGNTAEERVDRFFAHYWDPRHRLLQAELKNGPSLLPAQKHYLNPPESFINHRQWLAQISRPLGIRKTGNRLNPRDLDVHNRVSNIFPRTLLVAHRNTFCDAIKSTSWPTGPVNGGLLEIPFPANQPLDASSIRQHLFARCRWSRQYVYDVAEPYFRQPGRPPAYSPPMTRARKVLLNRQR